MRREVKMRRVSDYLLWLEPILKSATQEVALNCKPSLDEILSNKKLIFVINHSTPLSWLPAICLLAVKIAEAGGAARIPKGIVDKWFYTNPFGLFIAEYLSQTTRPQNSKEIIDSFSQAEQADLVLFPEGANTFFGNPSEIQAFRSPKFVEIARQTGVPILLAVHKGSENWSIPLQVPQQYAEKIAPFTKFFGPKLLAGALLNFPLPVQKIPLFSMTCELYHSDPTLSVAEEAEKIRLKMSAMLKDLR
jgi:hypothetical protein